jgi:adenylyltransferase/sulfurtransferase
VSLSDPQLDRYARHIVLKEIGGQGQLRLLAASVTLVGAGGIGSPALQYLAAAGLGRLRVIDHDRVSLDNLQRQVLYATADVGRPKTEAAAEAVRRLNPDIAIEAVGVRLGEQNVGELLAGADLVLDGSDNFRTRLLVSDHCTHAQIPLVSAAVSKFEGQLAVCRGWEPDKPCYRCLVGSDPDRPQASCSDEGVLGAMAGVMGSLAAMEAIRAVTGFGEDSAGKLLRVDALTLRFRTVRLAKDPGCPSCRG